MRYTPPVLAACPQLLRLPVSQQGPTPPSRVLDVDGLEVWGHDRGEAQGPTVEEQLAIQRTPVVAEEERWGGRRTYQASPLARRRRFGAAPGAPRRATPAAPPHRMLGAWRKPCCSPANMTSCGHWRDGGQVWGQAWAAGGTSEQSHQP